MTTGTSSSSSFTLSYDGPGLAEHSISVRQLGPALVALVVLFDRANYLVYGGGTTVDIKASAVRPGSFDVPIIVELVRLATPMLASPVVVSALNLRQIMVSSITLLKLLKGRIPGTEIASSQNIPNEFESFDMAMDGLEISATASPETMQSVLPLALELARDRSYRNSLRKVAEPLRRDGITRVTFKEGERELEFLEEDDLSFLENTLGSVDEDDNVIPRQMLKLVSPHFGNNKGRWKLEFGGKIHWFAIKDESFMAEVRDGSRSFADGDILVCEVRSIQRIVDDGKLKTELEILTVLEQLSRHEQGDQPRLIGF